MPVATMCWRAGRCAEAVAGPSLALLALAALFGVLGTRFLRVA